MADTELDVGERAPAVAAEPAQPTQRVDRVTVIKPAPRIFRILLERNAIAPEAAVFIDDVAVNAAAASRLGIHGIHFRSPAALRGELAAVGLL